MVPEDQESEGIKQHAAAEADQRLRAAREEQGLTVDQVALELRLERQIVLALEAADYASLGAPVFVRGYLRSYARLLGLPEDKIAASYAQEEVQPEEFRTRSMTTELKAGANLVNFVMWVGVSVIALGGLLYVFIDTDEPPESGVRQDFVTPEPEPEPASEPEPAPVTELSEGSAPLIEESPASASESEVQPGPQEESDAAPVIAEPESPPAEPPAPPVATEVTLEFRFAEDCWAEVSDARRRLIYGLEQAGTVRSVSGVPPFKLFLGNAPAVELTLDERDYDMSRKVRSGSKTARFSIDTAEIDARENDL